MLSFEKIQSCRPLLTIREKYIRFETTQLLLYFSDSYFLFQGKSHDHITCYGLQVKSRSITAEL